MSFSFRVGAALCLGLCLVLGGCGSKEPAQRTAFIAFLQTRILDKPGLGVPKLTEEEKGKFGDYAGHYAVISDFNDGMSSAVSQPMNALIAKGAIRSIAEVVARRGDIEQVQQGMATLRGALDKQQAAADQARAALKQPDDLKTVYDRAYTRTVTVPATTFKDVFPAVDFTLAETLKIADFLQKNAAKVKITGSNVTVEDPATLAELNKMLQSLQLRGAELSAAQRKLQTMVRG